MKAQRRERGMGIFRSLGGGHMTVKLRTKGIRNGRPQFLANSESVFS
jgi:hypothetical protein